MEGVTRVVIFLCYLILCSKTKSIRRVFSYHGAEHKTIFCYEKGLELTVENVRAQPKHHPRCGTSFLFVVIVVSIILSSIVFAFWRFTNPWMRTLVHLLLLPLVVGITWEINRYVGGHDGLICRIVRRPGMAIQRWTTFEPDDSMIEVGSRPSRRSCPRRRGRISGEQIENERTEGEAMATTYNNLYLDTRRQLRAGGVEMAQLEAGSW